MNKNCILFALVTLPLAGIFAQNQAPFLSGLHLVVDTAAHSAVLNFQLADPENDSTEITVQFSADGGKSFTALSGNQVSGDAGYPVLPGMRQVNCSGLDFSNSVKYVFRLVADDHKPFDIQALVNEVDSARIYSDMKFIQGIRHHTTGLAHLNETRDSIQSLLASKGMYMEKHSFPYSGTTGQNLIGSLAGTDSAKQVVIVDAHYDSVANAPGADDNGSGTVGMMEIARLLSRYPTKKTQRYIGFDFEESGLIGSSKYVTNYLPADEQIQGVFNFEMIAYWSDQPNTQSVPAGFGVYFPVAVQAISGNQYRGDFITNVGSAASASLELLFSNSAQQYVPDLKVITLNVPGNGLPNLTDLRRSDHTPFWDSGRKALMITDGANFRNECYHTPSDTLDNKLNMTFMTNVVKATLASAAQLAEVQHGGWATATYDLSITSATHELPQQCQVKVLNGSQILLNVPDCLQGPLQAELIDQLGRQVFAQKFAAAGGQTIRLETGAVPVGTYFLQITSASGKQAQQVVLTSDQ